MTTEEKPKKRQVDEATLRRLAEGRLKGLEIRRKKAELKKQEKAEEREKINKAYEERVLKKKPTPSEEVSEETDKEIYEQPVAPNNQSESDDEREEPVKARATKQTQRKPKQDVGSYNDTAPNYKNEYYRMKLERLRMQERDATLTTQQSQFQHHYANLPSQHHVIDIARNQLQNKVNQEVYNRVFKDLFNC